MALQIDKEVLIKHHFWILAGAFLLLVIVPMILLGTSVSATVAKEGEALKASETKLKGINAPKNEKWVEAYKIQDGFVQSKKDEVWQAAWETQKDMMTWPEDEYRYGNLYKYVGDPIADFHAESFRGVYKTQIPEVYWLIQPVISTGEGVVQFRGGESGWRDVLKLDQSFDNNPPPSTEDIWLAQENLWLRRELVRVIRIANDSVAFFQEVEPTQPVAAVKPAAQPAAEEKDKKDGKKDAGTEKDKKVVKAAPPPPRDRKHGLFRNPYWEIDLTLARSGQKYVLRGSIKNIGKRKQPLGIDFNVYLDDNFTKPAVLSIDHAPVAVGEVVQIKDAPVNDTLTVKGLYGVEQILTWKTAAVKRLDRMETAYNSSRTAGRFANLKKPRWVKDEAAAGGPTDSTKSTTNVGGGTSTSRDTSKNGIQLARYTDTNEQVRHIPVAMLVILDEDRIPEFLSAFANSKLRIQTLQTHWHHTREKIKPELAESGSPGTTGGGRGGPESGSVPRPGGAGGKTAGMTMGQPPMMSGGRSPMMGGGGGMGAMMGGQMSGAGSGMYGGGKFSGQPGGGLPGKGPGTDAGAEEEEAEMNLVELAVYGLASLYERYPPKPEPGSTASTTTPPSTTK